MAFAVSATAQTNDALLDKMSDETCECINKSIPEDADSDALLEKLGLCILPLGGKYKKELKRDYGLDMSKVDDFQKLGEIVGERLGERCERFLSLIMMEMSKEDSEMMDMVQEEYANGADTFEAEFPSITGEVQSYDESGIPMIKITDKDGETVELHAVLAFQGLGIFKLGKELTGKNIKAHYTDVEAYDAKSKSFKKINILKSIELL